MKKLMILISCLALSVAAITQPLSGTKNIPGDYASVALAVNALNTYGAGTGGVIFNITAGHTETSSNILITTTTSSFSNPVVFRKSGNGANPLITAAPGTSATRDGIIKIRGADYITFDGINIQDPVSNSNPTTRMEWGFAILMTSATDASQNIIIRNCSIILQKAYSGSPYSSGIYSKNHTDASTTLITPSGSAGVVSNCEIDSCDISDVIYGINWTGSSTSTYYGQNNYFGATAGNRITNFGGGSASTYGIYVNYQQNLKINNNQIAGGDGTTGVLYGIDAVTGTNSTAEFIGNSISLTCDATASQVYGIYNGVGGSGTSNTITVNSNSVTIINPAATTSITYSITQSAGAWVSNVNNNSVINCVIGGDPSATATGNFYGIYTFGSNAAAGSIWTISGNIVSNNARIQSIRGAGTSYGIYNSSSGLTLNITDNSINNNSWPSSGPAYGIYVSNSSATAVNVENNETFELSKPGANTNVQPRSGSLNGIYVIVTGTGAVTQVHNNMVHNLINTWGGPIYAFRCDAGSSSSIRVYENQAYSITGNDNTVYGIYNGAGLTNEIYSNEVYQVKALVGDSGCFNGISTGSSTTNSVTSVYNNYISDLSAPEANIYISSGLNCFSIVSGTVHRYHNNTVFLNQTSVSGNSNTAAVYSTLSPTLDMRNNILVNISSGPGTGITVVLWRSGTITSTFSTESDYNCLYSGTPGPLNLLYYGFDPVSPHTAQTPEAYKTYFPQEEHSFSELPPFINTISAPYDLRLSSGVSTACESGGSIITTPPPVNTDFDNEPRFPNPGYPDNANPQFTATAPDCGADEFGGIPTVNCTLPVPGNTLISASNICVGQTVTFSLQNQVPGTGIVFQWQKSSDGINFTDITGAEEETLITVPEKPDYYRCHVTCLKGPVSSYSTPVLVLFAHLVTSTTPGNRCGPGSVVLNATVNSGTLQWYTQETGGIPVGAGSPFNTPVISSTTTYYAAADIPSTGYVTSPGNSVTTGNESPFYHQFGGKKTQYLIKASELVSAGMSAGNISGLGIQVVTAGTTYNSFNIRIGHTNLTELGTPFQQGLTSVYTTAAITPFPGLNTYNFTAPFGWNGVSNLIIEMCWSNNNSGGNSCQVKCDATNFNSTGYYGANNQSSSVLCPVTSITGNVSARPVFCFNYTPACLGPRKPVIATVIPMSSLSVTPNQTLCSGEIGQVEVIDGIPGFQQFSWSPAPGLFTDAACLVPYINGASATHLYFRKFTSGIYTYTCTAFNSTTLCVNSALTAISVLPSPVIIATPSAICLSGSALLALSPSTGYQDALFQWQQSADSIFFTDITGATSGTYTTPVLTQTRYYKAMIKKPDGTLCSQPVTGLHVLHPEIVSTTPGSRCGYGTVLLSADASAGCEIRWYNSLTGGIPAGTGSTFITPPIGSTTLYYACAVMVNASVSCESPRVAVTAVVTQPPPVYVSAVPPSVCSGEQVIMKASSTDTAYQYTWMPGNLPGDSVVIFPQTSVVYTVSAINPSSGCATSANLPVTVLPTPLPVTITPSTPVIYMGTVVKLKANGGNIPGSGTGAVTITWSPFTELFLDAWANQPYGGESTDSVFARPSGNTTYIATAASVLSGCNRSAAVTVTVLYSCLAPSGIAISELTYTSVTLGFTEPVPVPGSGYEYEIREYGEPGSGLSGLVESGNILPGITSLTVNGLQPQTSYYAYLRGNCGDNLYSAWTTPFFFVTLSLPPLVNGIAIPATCYGVCEGAINLDVSGGTPPYSYLWSSGATTQNISDLCSGYYQVSVTDAANQTGINGWFVTQGDAIDISGSYQKNVSCNGAYDGEITIVATGGAPPFTYQWEGPYAFYSYEPHITDLCPGLYYLTITDAHSCVLKDTFTMTEPYMLQIAAVKRDISCHGADNGYMKVVSMVGGTAPYFYQWSNGATTDSIGGLSTGFYWLTVADINGCDAFTGNYILEPAAISLTGTVNNAICPWSNDGQINVSTGGGASPYLYTWSNGSTNQHLAGLSPGTYSLTVTDANNCQTTGSWNVGQSIPLCSTISVTGLIQTPVCYDASDTIKVAGGGHTFEVLPPGTVSFIAGKMIRFFPGTTVAGGGKMTAKIAPSGPYCTGVKITDTVQNTDNGFSADNNQRFKIYPNPTNGNFRIFRAENPNSSSAAVHVFNSNGRLVLNDIMEENIHEVVFEQFPAGLYFIKITDEDETVVLKLFKTN